MTALIRGPEHLREDIADEIADHLASHLEDELSHRRDVDATIAEADAVRAFGDPDAVARELRTIHMGDWIMFQRIMVASLVVIVMGIAATAYFSWSAARQQSEQFAQMNERLGSLVELQKQVVEGPRPLAVKPEPAPAAAPPAAPAPKPVDSEPSKPKDLPLRIYCFAGSPEKAVAGYKVRAQMAGSSASWDLITNKEGWTGLTPHDGLVSINGSLLSSQGERIGEVTWWRNVKLEAGQKPIELRVNVSPQDLYDIQFDLSEVRWNRSIARRLRVTFEQQAGEELSATIAPMPRGRGQTPPAFWERGYKSRSYEVSSKDGPENRISGLLPGPVVANVSLLAGPNDVFQIQPETDPGARETPKDVLLGSWHVETSVPEQPGPVNIKLAPPAESKIAAVLFAGSRDHPVAHKPLGLIYPVSTPQRPAMPRRRGGPPSPAPLSNWSQYAVAEYLTTNDRGEFTALTAGEYPDASAGSALVPKPYLAMPWQTADGKPADFRWPLFSGVVKEYRIEKQGTLYELDMSQVATLRLAFSGLDKMYERGARFVGPLQIGAPNWLPVPPLQLTWNRIDCLAREVDARDKTADLLLIASDCSVDLSMVIAEAKADAPELESHKFYSRPFTSIKLTAGEVKELPVAFDDLDKWKLEKTEWHRREPAATQTQSAR